MQGFQQRRSSSTPQRSANREEHSPGVLFTALTIGAVVLLLAVTFVADWLRTPDLNILDAPQFLSPNQDNSFDTATINYRLSEKAAISARVYNAGGSVVRQILDTQPLPAGQHFLEWDGNDDLGQRVSDGSYRIEISAQGAVRSKSSSVALLVDTLPPALQLVNMPEGGRVREALLPVEGLTDATATVWLTGIFEPIAVDAQGRFRTQIKLSEGLNQVEVRASDPAGNTTSLNRSVDVVTAPPEVVISTPSEGAWINNPLVTVEGQAPAGTTLKINNQAVPLSPDGSFRFDVLLNEGEQAIQVTATDDVGNVTTLDRFVRVKTTGPGLELNIVDGATFSDPLLRLSGRTSPGSSLVINQQSITVGSLGDFQTSLSLLKGENVVVLEARDIAGNATNLTRRVRYELPVEVNSLERLLRNFDTLPAATLPVVLLLSLGVGFFLYRQNQLSIQLSVEAQSFTPGLPQEGKALELRLDLNQPAQVTLEVIDQNGLTQATLLDHRRRSARQHVLLWDGYDDFGRPVPAGPYTIRATAGAPPIKVSSAVQIQIEEDPYVYRKASQFEKVQTLSTTQTQAHRRSRQNRKRI